MIKSCYMGVDPGPSTGVVLLFVHDDGQWEWLVFQVNYDAAFWLIQELYTRFVPRVVVIEKFIATNKAGTTGADADRTRRIAEHAYQLVPTIKRIPAAKGYYAMAANHKPWASDHRLKKTKFPMGDKFKDAKDGARLAMYGACYYGKERDPLS